MVTIRVPYAGQELAISANVRTGGAEWVVFLHGLGCTKESFDAAFMVDALDDFSICGLDLPGHGGSTALPPDSCSLSAYADIVHLVIGQLAAERVHLVCHSMGGGVGLLVAEQLRQLGCFVSVEGNLIAEDCGIVSRQIAAQARGQFVRHGYAALHRELVSAGSADLLAWARWYASCDPATIHATARSLVEWSDSGKLLDLFTGLRRPSYVYGDTDGRLDHLLPALADVPTFPVAGSGHFPMIDNGHDFYSLLADLLTGPDQTRATGRRLTLATS